MRMTCGAPGGSVAGARIGRGDDVHHQEGRRDGALADLQRHDQSRSLPPTASPRRADPSAQRQRAVAAGQVARCSR